MPSEERAPERIEAALRICQGIPTHILQQMRSGAARDIITICSPPGGELNRSWTAWRQAVETNPPGQ